VGKNRCIEELREDLKLKNSVELKKIVDQPEIQSDHHINEECIFQVSDFSEECLIQMVAWVWNGKKNKKAINLGIFMERL
jgi:hypothetical protein